MKYDEKRAFMRINMDSEMRYRLVDSSEFKTVRCTSLSGSGVSFVSAQSCDEGIAMEINITPQSAITPAFTAFVEVVRVEPLDNSEFEIAAAIKTIKG
ncbi:MAG: PilZ domain-containing protein [Methylococcales bacterium]|nr:PilZ domain-containing protein [Methylococcales bacterium]MDD5753259.1 PilZ domain-containing protein [Methylococcales bacterium]